MKILFVRPDASPETIGLQHVMLLEPLELELIAATIREHDTAVIIDMVLEKLPFEYHISIIQPDIVCFTGYITHVSIIKSYCKKVKRMLPGSTTIVGGVHCEVCPEDFEDASVDFRVVRNAVIVFPKLLDYIESKNHAAGDNQALPGVLAGTEAVGQLPLPPFDFTVPFPDRSLVEKYRRFYFYIFHNRVALLKTSFGCPGHCTFCFCRVITGNRYVQRPLDHVINELKTIDERDVYIVDDDFLADKDRVIDFIARCRNEGITKKYLIYGRADFIAQNPDVIKQFKAIGLTTVIVGFESFSDQDLNLYNKQTGSNCNTTAIAVLHQNRVDCYATLILPPHWKVDDFESCTRNLLKLGIHYVNLQPLTPLPKTGVTVDNNKLILNRTDYEKWDLAHVSIKPDYLPVYRYYQELLKMYSAILFQPKVLIRYLFTYSIRMNFQLLIGSMRVRQQYLRKIREARRNA